MSDLRMPDLNKVFLAARLTRDPELKYLPSGMAVCELGLAASRKYKDKAGEMREDTLFVNATCWGKTAEYVGEHLRKGRPVIVEGRLKTDQWEDKTSGQKRSKVQITADRVQLIDWEDREGSGGGGGGQSRPAPRPIEEPIPEDDIPF